MVREYLLILWIWQRWQHTCKSEEKGTVACSSLQWDLKFKHASPLNLSFPSHPAAGQFHSQTVVLRGMKLTRGREPGWGSASPIHSPPPMKANQWKWTGEVFICLLSPLSQGMNHKVIQKTIKIALVCASCNPTNREPAWSSNVWFVPIPTLYGSISHTI